MAQHQTSRWCASCERKTLHAYETSSMCAGCFLSVITLGLFLPFWGLAMISDSFKLYRCQSCGRTNLPGFMQSRWRSSTGAGRSPPSAMRVLRGVVGGIAAAIAAMFWIVAWARYTTPRPDAGSATAAAICGLAMFALAIYTWRSK